MLNPKESISYGAPAGKLFRLKKALQYIQQVIYEHCARELDSLSFSRVLAISRADEMRRSEEHTS